MTCQNDQLYVTGLLAFTLSLMVLFNNFVYVCMYVCMYVCRVSLNHDGTDGSDGTGIQSVLPVPSASVAGLSVPSVSNSRSN